MSKRLFLTAALLATLAASSASGQLGGGGPVGGLGGLGGGLGGAAGGAGGAVGGAVGGVGGAVGGVGGAVGGVGGAVGGAVGNAAGSLSSGLAGGPLGDALGSATNSVTNATNEFGMGDSISLDQVYDIGVGDSSPGEIENMRKARLNALIRTYPKSLERDDRGQPVRKGEVMVINPDPASLATLLRAGFRIKADDRSADLGLRVVTLLTPKGMNSRDGLKALRRAAPALEADFNHVYEPAGGALLPAMASALASAPPIRAGTRIAMIDGGVASHPALASAGIEQRGFSGPPQPTGHGTAVGSLLVGEQGSFRGAARGAQLYVGDVFGGSPAAGSAASIVRALAWAASKRPAVINISLIGPDNRTLARAVAALRARGVAMVAAVGNDGPAAPPQYPASYDGVIAVTGVDGGDRALNEAGKARHLDFAAPGADLVAALPGNGYTPVRGTSFAAPFVAARLAATGSTALLAAEAVPGKGKVGFGIVCRTCRVAPKMVGLKMR